MLDMLGDCPPPIRNTGRCPFAFALRCWENPMREKNQHQGVSKSTTITQHTEISGTHNHPAKERNSWEHRGGIVQGTARH